MKAETSAGLADRLAGLDAIVSGMLRAARVPGAAVAIVLGDELLFAKGYGYRDCAAKLPMTADTLYPIASTSKAINATLLGMLVDARLLAWDVPVQNYWPQFQLWDPMVSAQVTLRDLIVMRTGLPRHDWVWLDSPEDRAALLARLRYLKTSSGFRERYQYNNLSVTAAGHVAEIATGRSWESLVRERILEPLRMQLSGFAGDFAGAGVTQSYHERVDRQLVMSRLLRTQVTAPSGGALYSTVADMARWVAFNLCGGLAQGRQLIEPQTLAEIQSPQIGVGAEFGGLMRSAAYGMGWFVDTYNGSVRLSHGGYLHDVQSEVTLLPRQRVGVVSFINFGPPSIAGVINEHACDLVLGRKPVRRVEEKLALYEQTVAETLARSASVNRVADTRPSHALRDYAGRYVHPGYGSMEIEVDRQELVLRRHSLVMELQHWHYDAWIVRDADPFTIHAPHPFHRYSRLAFETNCDGDIVALSLGFEPAVAAIRFEKAR
jgi:CubicO group peptidase (beta-lactamase class C family)